MLLETHELCLFQLDPTNKNNHITTPPLLLLLPLTSTLAPHLNTIDDHYRQYISSFMSRSSMRVFGPFCSIDPDIPLYMYFDGSANRLPIFTVKYEQTIVRLQPKKKWRKNNMVVMMREGHRVDMEREKEKEGETVNELVERSKLGKGVCHVGRRRVSQDSKLDDLDILRPLDTNIYIRIDPS